MSASLSILHIIDSGGFYGAEVMLLTLVEEQIKLGLRPVIASIGDPGVGEKPLESEARRKGFALERFRMRPGPNFIGAGRVLQFARNRGVNILHTHGYKGNILFGLMPQPIRRLPLVSTLHGWTHTGHLNRMWFYEALDAKSLRYMDAVVLVDEQMRHHRRLRNRPGVPFHVVRNGIPDTPAEFTTTNENSDIETFCHRGPTLGTIGRLSPEKAQDGLLTAVKALKGEFPDLQLVIIGDGRLRSEMGQKADQLGIASRVMFAGYRDQAWGYLPFFAMFILPSLTEGLPITLLEAMRAERPIIASAVGGIPSALNDGAAGFLIRPGANQELINAIRAVLQDDQMAQNMAVQARKAFLDRFSSQHMAAKYDAIYRSVARRAA